MPIITELQENGHVCYVKITDPWTLADLAAEYAIEQTFRDQSTFPIHNLVDFREMHRVPPAVLPLARRAPIMNHPRPGVLVLLGGNSFAQVLVETVARITRSSKIKFFKNEDEARVYLRQVITSEPHLEN